MPRLNVNINDETAAALRELAARHQVTVTEVVRRAVSVHHFLRAAQREGQEIQLVESGTVTRVVIL